jgi:transglutaminase-like putative cysteine protease
MDSPLDPFLRSTEIIDRQHPAVRAKSRELAGSVAPASRRLPTDPDPPNDSAQVEIARRCFEFVRDEIQHSSDFHRNPVTCAASEVLAHGTGYCYAKSHLLAALLHANRIPAGFCYQRLSIHDNGAPFSLHGFNAVHLPQFGWYRVDARGNKPGVDAQFNPPHEKLAFRLNFPEERLFAEILPDPLPSVVEALHSQHTWDAMLANLPDWDCPTLRPLAAESVNLP